MSSSLVAGDAPRRPAAPAVAPAPGFGGEGLELLGEALHVGLHGAGLAMPQPQDETADQADDHRQPEIGQVRHGPDRTSAMGWAQLDQSTPPSHVSRFQMGTVAFKVSMQKRAAAKDSARCGAEATTTTDVSPTSRSPVR